MIKKKGSYGLAFLVAANLAIRHVESHLGLDKEPLPPEVRLEGYLIKETEEERINKVYSFDDNIEKIDSLYNRHPGRHQKLREIHQNRRAKGLFD